MGGDRLDVAPAGGPMDEQRHSMPSVILALLPAPHAGVEDLFARARAVVAGEDKDRILGQALFFEESPQAAHVVVDVRDHAEEVPHVGAELLLAGCGELRRRVHGPMRGVRRNMARKRLARLLPRPNETPSVVEPDVSAIALDRFRRRVVEVRAVEAGVVPEVGRLAHSTAAVAHHLAEAAVLGPKRVVVAHVPLAEHSGGAAGVKEDLAHGEFVLQ